MRAGKPRPDISTVNAFKETLFQAKSIGIQSTSAVYLKTKVFPQLGIADALTDKLSGAGAAEVASGGVEMVVLPVSEILPVRGEQTRRAVAPTSPERERSMDCFPSGKGIADARVEKTGMIRVPRCVLVQFGL